MKNKYSIALSFLFFVLNHSLLLSQTSPQTFNFTGSVQTFTVPPCVTTLTVVVAGAKGGGSNGGNGARITATLNVTPGQILNIYCGGMGSQGNNSGGWNGGGTGHASSGSAVYSSFGGGGASDIRIGGTALANRVVVAGGGGGRSGGSGPVCGGAANCNNGAAGCTTYGTGGGGGTQTAGGAGGAPWAGTPPGGAPGTLGNGGQGGLWQTASGGGGGGGFYGGGGGGNDGCCTGSNGGGGGGGGSSLIPAGAVGALVNCQPANNAGNGFVTISWTGSSPTISATNNGPACSGSNVQLNVTTTPGATYSWTGPSSFTSTTQNPLLTNITSSMTGAYSVTVTANGCTSTATTTVNILPSPTITVSSASICAGQGTATLTATGASSYSWSTGTSPSTGASVTTSPASTTTFTVTGTASNNCTATAVSTVTVNSLPQVTVNSTSICLGQGTATLTASGASSYSWSVGTVPSTGSIVTANPSTPSNYTVTGTDLNGCTNTAIATVGIYQLPIINVNSPSICPGTTATLIASGASSYTWSSGTTPNSGTNVSVTPISTEQYTVTGTDINGCISSATSTVTVNPTPQVDAGADDTICSGNTIILLTNISPGATATWNPGNLSGPVHVFPASSTTTYTLSVIDANGCSGIDSLQITVPPLFTLTMTSLPVSCNGLCDGQATATPSPSSGPFTNYNYFWQSGGSTNQTATSLCTGNYTVTATNDVGCTQTGTVNVAQPTAVSANASGIQPATCNNSCDGQVTINANGGTGTYTFNWSPSGIGSNPTNLCAGNYTCTVTDGNNCSVSVPVVITQPTVLTASINPVSTICIGQNATLTVVPSGGNGGNTFNWSPGTTPSNLATVSVSPTVTASYSVIVTDANGCSSSPVSVTVNVNPPLNVVAGQNITICSGQTAQLSAIASGGNGVYSYTWSPATTPTAGSTVNSSPNSTTTYTVTATDACGTPPASDQIVVNVNQLPVLSISSSVSSGCNPVCATFTANSNVLLNTVSWTFTDNQNASGSTTSQICFDTPGTYGATINVTDINNCQNSYTNNNLVTSFPVPQADFSFSPISATILSPIIEFQDQSAGAVITNWSWSFGDPTDAGSTQQNPSFTYPTTGTYDVWLTVVSNNGCIDSINHPVVIGPEFVIYVPNAFTPNGDGVNDVFYPQGMGIDTETFELWIFDRWGNLVFNTNDFYKSWDGKPNGKEEVVMQDVYVWKITVKTFDGTKKNIIGHVSVVR